MEGEGEGTGICLALLIIAVVVAGLFSSKLAWAVEELAATPRGWVGVSAAEDNPDKTERSEAVVAADIRLGARCCSSSGRFRAIVVVGESCCCCCC